MLDQETEDKYMKKLKNLKSKSSKFIIAESVEVTNIPGSWHSNDNSIPGEKSFIKITDCENKSLYVPLKNNLTRNEIIEFSKFLLNYVDCSSYSIVADLNNK